MCQKARWEIAVFFVMQASIRVLQKDAERVCEDRLRDLLIDCNIVIL